MFIKTRHCICTDSNPEQFMTALESATRSEMLRNSTGFPEGSVAAAIRGRRFSLCLRHRRAWPIHGLVGVRAGKTRIVWRYPAPLHSRVFVFALALVMALLAGAGFERAHAGEIVACVAMLIAGSVLLLLIQRNGHPIQRRLERLIVEVATMPAHRKSTRISFDEAPIPMPRDGVRFSAAKAR